MVLYDLGMSSTPETCIEVCSGFCLYLDLLPVARATVIATVFLFDSAKIGFC